MCSEIHPVSSITLSEGTVWLHCNLFNYPARSSPLNYSSMIAMCFQMSEECQSSSVLVYETQPFFTIAC